MLQNRVAERYYGVLIIRHIFRTSSKEKRNKLLKN